MGARWESCKRIYESQGVNAEFRTYPGIGHEITPEIKADILSFFIMITDGSVDSVTH